MIDYSFFLLSRISRDEICIRNAPTAAAGPSLSGPDTLHARDTWYYSLLAKGRERRGETQLFPIRHIRPGCYRVRLRIGCGPMAHGPLSFQCQSSFIMYKWNGHRPNNSDLCEILQSTLYFVQLIPKQCHVVSAWSCPCRGSFSWEKKKEKCPLLFVFLQKTCDGRELFSNHSLGWVVLCVFLGSVLFCD